MKGKEEHTSALFPRGFLDEDQTVHPVGFIKKVEKEGGVAVNQLEFLLLVWMLTNSHKHKEVNAWYIRTMQF